MNRNKKKIFIRVFALICIIIIIPLLEVIFNYHAIKDGYDNVSFYNSFQSDEYNDYYSFETSEPIYVKQIILYGKFTSRPAYLVNITYVNRFGIEEETEIFDIANDWVSHFYTNINKKVKSVTVTIPNTEEHTIEGIELSNCFEWNFYRMLFFAVVLFIIYAIVFLRTWFAKPEKFFLMFALLFGVLNIVLVQPKRASWDEQIHFSAVYRLSSGKTVIWSRAAYDLINVNEVACDTKADFAELRQAVDSRGEEYALTEHRDTMLPRYYELAYLPMVLFVKIGLMLRLSFSKLYMFGKLGNLIVYIIVMYWAIRVAKGKKTLLLFLATVPTIIFQASSYTYDSFVFSLITFGCVLWFNEMMDDNGPGSLKNVIACVFLFTLGSLSKAVYIPIIFLILTMPLVLKKRISGKVVVFCGITLIVMIVMSTFLLPVLYNTVTVNLDFGGDTRGGDTSIVRQIISMVRHPAGTVRMLLEFNNYRYLQPDVYESNDLINLMFMNMADAGILENRWAFIEWLPFAFLLFYDDSGNRGRKIRILSGKALIWIILVLASVIGMIWMAMYLTFTPVGYEHIVGVQLRYYLPLLYLIGIIIGEYGFTIRADGKTVKTAIPLIILGVEAVACYQILLLGRMV